MATAKKTRTINVIESRSVEHGEKVTNVALTAPVTVDELKTAINNAAEIRMKLAFNFLAGNVSKEFKESAPVRGELKKMGISCDQTIGAIKYLVELKALDIRKAWSWHCSQTLAVHQPSPQTLMKAHKAMLKANEQPEEEASETEASETSAKVKAKTATFADRFLKAWIALDKETQTKPELVALFDLAVDAGWQE